MPDGAKLGEWDAPTRVWALAISSNGKLLASGGTDNKITLWSTESGERLQTLDGHVSAIADGDSLDFSPDGRRLASASFDETARIWDLETGKTLHTLRWHKDRMTAVAFSPDGKLIATGSYDKRIVLWDAETGRALRLFTGHDNIVFDVAFDATGRRLLSASRDNTMRLWDVATGVTLRVYQGHTLYTAANDQTVRRWSLDTPAQWLWQLPGEPISAAVAPDGSLRAYELPGAVGWVEERNPSSQPANDGFRYALPILQTEVGDAHGQGGIKRIAFDAEGDRLATAGMDGTAKLWRIDRTEGGLDLTLLHTLEGHKDGLRAVAFSPDGRTLATAGYDRRVGLFDVESGEGELFEAHEGRIANVEFAHDGKDLLSVGVDDFKLCLWDITKQPPEPREVAKAQDMLAWASLRPDGRQLATGGGDATVRLWDLDTAKELFAIRFPTDVYVNGGPSLQDFDFRCTQAGDCWIAVPLTMGRLALYRLPYLHPPASLNPR